MTYNRLSVVFRALSPTVRYVCSFIYSRKPEESFEFRLKVALCYLISKVVRDSGMIKFRRINISMSSRVHLFDALIV